MGELIIIILLILAIITLRHIDEDPENKKKNKEYIDSWRKTHV